MPRTKMTRGAAANGGPAAEHAINGSVTEQATNGNAGPATVNGSAAARGTNGTAALAHGQATRRASAARGTRRATSGNGTAASATRDGKDTEHPRFIVERGRAHPLGATPDQFGVNFSLYSGSATAVTLLLFDDHDCLEPIFTVELDNKTNKTFHFWHCYVRGAQARMHYAYRVDGPPDVHGGHRFNRNKVLIDPYARGNTDALWERGSACGPGDNLATSMRSVIIDSRDYDWEGDKPLRRPMAETIIYELHVGGFTKSPTSGVAHPGTFSGIVEKIPYLKDLGVTAVELLPVFQFDPSEIDKPGPDGTRLTNYWGYSTVGFFSPHHAYCVGPEDGDHLTEFRDMVKALHKAGIEVILDVVFNHTSEGNHQGPTISFKGMDNSVYYHLSPQDRQYYMDYSGCGNTVNCNHPLVEKFIVDCLEFWVKEMHVDGFRFDEGSILSRGEDGTPLVHPPVIWYIELDEAMADTKIIAEAWDAAGLYQIGHFPGRRWAEWNGRYRDDVRRFVRGDPGLVGAVASRIAGSADIYQSNGELPINSINFITCHDGFTLNDLLSYNGKHNDANGEGNRDGIDENLSWNHGGEGETDDPAIRELRCRQAKNFFTILMLSQGVPMVTGGDEVLRTQRGNNNAYCQDSELSWFDWSLVEKHQDLHRYVKHLIHRRRHYTSIHRPRYFTGEENARGLRDISWHGCKLYAPGWNDPHSRVLAFTLGGDGEDHDLHAIVNMDPQDLDFELPVVPGRAWHRAVDTALPSPKDIVWPGHEERVEGNIYRARGRSVVVLLSKDTQA